MTFTEPRELQIQQSRSMKNFREIDFYTDYDQFLSHKALDTVIVSVPIPLNANFAIKGLKKNKHVFAAKPFALTLQEGIEPKEAALNAGTTFMENYQFRYSPFIQSIRSQLNAGTIGNLRLIWNARRNPGLCRKGHCAVRNTERGSHIERLDFL